MEVDRSLDNVPFNGINYDENDNENDDEENENNEILVESWALKYCLEESRINYQGFTSLFFGQRRKRTWLNLCCFFKNFSH